ncbi:type IV pilin protein [Motiliproteus sp. SC1-56]|uniref:type IV pilin protein n=1 Tax=Motiliproteus sp. SC1-56 TaxID=2799565 RepID=UPI001A8E86D6|nr:type IV pilin protein [Motiliproteus sp. SC1-56]
MSKTRFSQGGFSLLELMIALVIVGIIAAIGYPSYQAYLVDSRRTDAQGALLAFVTAMERYRTNHSTYLGAEADTSFPSPPDGSVYPSQSPVDSSKKYYDLSIQSADAGSYVLRATPISGTPQEGTGYLEITSTGIKRWDRDDNGVIGSGETSWSN